MPEFCTCIINLYSFSYFSVANLADRFMSISPQQKNQLEDEANDYIVTPLQDLPKYDSNAIDLNQFWHAMGKLQLPGGKAQFPLLHQLSKTMLTITQSNADTERVFSMLKKIQTDSRDNLADKTIHRLLSVKINNTDECHQYQPEPDVVKAAKKACASYKSQFATSSSD